MAATTVGGLQQSKPVVHWNKHKIRRKGYSEERLKTLAQFKKTHPGFLEDRRSVYWVDKIPPKPLAKCALTNRQLELVKSKEYHKDFKPDRPSSIWQVPKAALMRRPSQRLSALALPKPFHPQWMAMRSPFSVVPDSAMNVQPTKRLEQLCQPKAYAPLPIKSDSDWDWGDWALTVPKAAASHVASARLEQLAEPKPSSSNYVGNRSVIWPVAPAAMRVQATTRVQQLARPKTRQALDQDYDPYKVSFAARMAVPSPRVVDLALPIPRKVRAKKT